MLKKKTKRHDYPNKVYNHYSHLPNKICCNITKFPDDDDDDDNNSIIYYLYAESTATRPITDSTV
jgi:hypothetical protein